ncbi:MAG: hypothetical protein U0572_00250 [Phycisphaerales bacterium]
MQQQLNKRRGATGTYVALAGLAAAWAASSADCQMVQAGQDTRTGTIFANDFVRGGSTASYAIGPSTLYDPVNYLQVVADGPAVASLITNSHWMNMGPLDMTDGFTVTGQCYTDLSVGFGTATSSDHLQIGLAVSGLPSGGSIPFRFSGVLVNTLSAANVSIVGPGLSVVIPQGWNNWDFDVLFYNNGVYTLTIDTSSSLTNVQGPDLGQLNYSVTLRRKIVVPNDLCENATPVEVGTYPVTNINATGSTALPAGCESSGLTDIANDVFFSYVAPVNGVATVSTCNASDFDSWLAAYTGPCGAPNFVACSDDGDGCGVGAGSLMSFPTTAGETYTIVLGGWYGATGNADMTISQTVVNDTCAGATPISVGVTHTSTIGATGDSILPATCEEGYGLDVFNDVFFTYEATATGIVTVSTCSPNTTFDTRLAVYSGSCDDLTLIACNDDAGSECGNRSIATFEATCGERYVIQLGSYDGGVGLADLSVSQTGTCAAPCPADLSGNGSVGAEDLGILLGQWGVSGNGDLNGNGVVDAGDLGILLGVWGSCG